VWQRLKEIRYLITEQTRMGRFQAALVETGDEGAARAAPKILLHRLGTGAKAGGQKKCVCMQAFGQLCDVASSMLRPTPAGARNQLVGLDVTLAGEAAEGKEGPYRQLYSDLFRELTSGAPIREGLQQPPPLLMPVPSNLDSGLGSCLQIPQPLSCKAEHRDLFWHTGRLFGLAVRTGITVPISLPSIFWKVIVEEPLDESDLLVLDAGVYTALRTFSKMAEDMDDEAFADSMEFMSVSSSETVLSTPPGKQELRVHLDKQSAQGYWRRIERSERDEPAPAPSRSMLAGWRDLVTRTRLNEGRAQALAVRAGLCEVIPEQTLGLFQWETLAKMVCGTPEVDVALWAQHTEYRGNVGSSSGLLSEDSTIIKWFWEVMREFSNEQRGKVVRFVFGVERLPTTEAEYKRTHTQMTMMVVGDDLNPDGRLPKSQVCFLQLKLSNYSSKEVLKRRLLAVVNMDVDAMDGDNVEHRSS